MFEDRLAYQMRRALHQLRLAADAALRPINLTTPQYGVITAIAQNPGASNADLARQAVVTPQTMNAIINGLVQAGLLTRRPHPQHGRVIQLFLTADGEAILCDAHRRFDAVEARMVAGLAPAEAAHLTDLLRRCGDALDVPEPPAPA
jgi:DNA-binding MarR family transcriptional regulator